MIVFSHIVDGIVAICAAAILAGFLIDLMDDDAPD